MPLKLKLLLTSAIDKRRSISYLASFRTMLEGPSEVRERLKYALIESMHGKNLLRRFSSSPMISNQAYLITLRLLVIVSFGGGIQGQDQLLWYLLLI